MRWIILGVGLLALLVGAALVSSLATAELPPPTVLAARPPRPERPSPPSLGGAPGAALPSAERPPQAPGTPAPGDGPSPSAAAQPVADESSWNTVEAIPLTELEPEDAGVLSELSKKGIQDALQAKRSEIISCYSDVAPGAVLPAKPFKVEVRIAANSDWGRGVVTGVTVEQGQSLEELALARCVHNVLRTTRFEAPPMGFATIRSPLLMP